MPYLLEGRKVAPQAALAEGMIDDTVATIGELVPAAKAWIVANAGNEDGGTAWDRKGFRLPGGNASSPNWPS